MDEQRVSVETRQIELLLADGMRMVGKMFLQLQGVHLTGLQRAGEVLNGEDRFLPVSIDGRVKLVNLVQVVAVYVAAKDEFDPLLELGEEHQVRVTPAVGEPLDARIYVNLPNGYNRAKDFLNQKKRFLPFLVGEQVVYLTRNRILLVED